MADGLKVSVLMGDVSKLFVCSVDLGEQLGIDALRQDNLYSLNLPLSD